MWERLINTPPSDPTVGQVAEALADATETPVGRAYDAVEATIEDGVLREVDDGGLGTVELAETVEDSEPDEEEPAKQDANPWDKTPETAEDGLLFAGSEKYGVAEVAGEHYPATLTDRDYWVTWILDGAERKRPVAPWETGHAYPVEWRDGLDDDHRPETSFKTARGWAEFSLDHLGLSLPDDARSDALRLGLILPAERPPREERVTLIDWDDVRDPESGVIHHVAAEYIRKYGGYVEVSRSGKGLHQYVLGGLRKRGKFIAPVDAEPWVGDDRPQVEVYDGGRHVAMTGRHVAGTDEDIVPGQDCIDDIVREYAGAELDAGHRVRDPTTGAHAEESVAAGDHSTGADGTDAEGAVPDPTEAEYHGPPLEDLRADAEAADRSLGYHAAVRAFCEGDAGVLNWRLEGAAAAIGAREGRDVDDVLGDLRGDGRPDGSAGFDRKTRGRLEYDHERARREEFSPPSWRTFVAWGVLPAAVLDDGDDGDASEEPDGDRRDPREVEVTHDPEAAWRAAGAVEPADLDEPLPLEPTDDGTAWRDPATGARVDIVRAVARVSGRVGVDETLRGEDYASAYERAREVYGASLPRYLTNEDATARFDVLCAAIGEVGFFDLKTDTVRSEVTAEGEEVGGEAVRALDPAWRESESGESVLVFNSGNVWDAYTETTLDVVRFVALETGLLGDPTGDLSGERFTEAVRRARTEYRAPLPRWETGTPDDRVPLLPPADELVDGERGGRDDLEDVWRETAGLVDERARDRGAPSVVTSLPATGKTTGAIRTARDRPTAYLAPRKELMADAANRADDLGLSYQHLPTLGGAVREDVLEGALAAVREEGEGLLRDHEELLDAALGRSDASDGDDVVVDDDEDGDDGLNRPTCGTAEGDHGAAWALAVAVARERGYRPREIHTSGYGLFGEPVPCGCAGPCDYTAGWDAVADPDAPLDLIIGHYVHANVESVRTHYTRGEDGGVERGPRSVLLDEFPGLDAFADEFGSEAFDHVAWLGGALCEDVTDLRDVYEADLWSDEFVRAWLDGDADDLPVVAGALDALTARERLAEAAEGARRVLDGRRECLARNGLTRPLEALTEPAGPDPEDLRGLLLKRTEDLADKSEGLAEWIHNDVLDPLERAIDGGGLDAGLAEALDRLGAGETLRAVLGEALDAGDAGDRGATERLRGAKAALRGGPEGARALALWSDDGRSHPGAHFLLRGVVAPSDDGDGIEVAAQRLDTEAWVPGDVDTEDGTTLNRVTHDKTTVLVDRNDRGAIVFDPPSRTAGDGDPAPLVGLDATGRRSLWSLALGEEVTMHDIHDGDRERRQFLRDVLDLQVLQVGDEARAYEGDPFGKDLDGDVELLRELKERYAGTHGPRDRDDDAERVDGPACITTKCVRDVLEGDDRLDGVVSAWDNYGNVTGDNDLGEHTLAAVLGTQHYGHATAEYAALLAGEETRPSGRGMALDYGSALANDYLGHMREDQLMQAVLRFARGDTGALVAVRTAAVRDDLPVVGTGRVATTWSETATTLAEAWRTKEGATFTAADLADDVDVSRRHVRRTLAELADAGVLRVEAARAGVATEYEPTGPTPRAAEYDFPDASAPGRETHSKSYTANVRVRVAERDAPPVSSPPGSVLPAPIAAAEGDPPD